MIGATALSMIPFDVDGIVYDRITNVVRYLVSEDEDDYECSCIDYDVRICSSKGFRWIPGKTPILRFGKDKGIGTQTNNQSPED